MSKTKNRKRLRPAAPPAASTSTTRAPAARRAPARPIALFGALGLGVIAVVGAGIWLLTRPTQPVVPAATTPVAQTAASTKQWPFGAAARCATNPKFVATFGFDEQRAALSTSERTVRGLVLIEIGANGDLSQKGRRYQHETWDDAGYLGPIARDGLGNVWAAPVPVISTLFNPTINQNDLWRADAVSGVLTKALSLPPAAQPDETNPYGILGLALDCDTNSLYVSSVLGSTRRQENGRLYRIDLASGQVRSQLDGIDVIGMGVFNGSRGKRLYFGTARRSEIRSIALDDSGNFAGQARIDINLEGKGPRGDDKARRISFLPNNDMQVFGIEFGFNLIAPTEKQETQYRFRYDAAADTWADP
jgi:hypothetical protein